MNVGARPSVLRGKLVSENSREEPVSLKCSEGLANVNSESSSLCVGGRARQRECRSSSICVEGRARQ